MRLLSIAALQIAPQVGDPEATLTEFERRAIVLGETFNDLQLIVAPELHLMAVGGFFDERPGEAAELAVEIPGVLTARLGALAQAMGVWLVPGTLYERAQDRAVHNTAVAISPQGEVVIAYRKCFPWQPYEESVPGTRLAVF